MPRPQTVRNTLVERFDPTTPAEAAALLQRVYGLAGVATRLSSEADETFAIATAAGGRLILKLAHPGESAESLAFQNDALLHLEKAAPTLCVPRLIPALSGEICVPIGLAGQTIRHVRAMTWLDGRQLREVPSTTPLMGALGNALGELDLALAGYRPAVPEIDLIWDLARAPRIRPLLAHVTDTRVRNLAESAFAGIETEVEPRRALLPRQIIHNDINPYNVLVAGGELGGIVDFGDMVLAPRVNDLAIALSYQIGNPQGPMLARALAAGYMARVPLIAAERQALGALVRGRLAMTIAITEWRSTLRPDHAAYIKRNQPVSVAGLEVLAGLDAAGLQSFFFGDR